jgi:hypothetical protein
MDLDRMLERCRRDQWSVSDLDWTRRPREMSREDEIAIVQLFTDMAGIERLAGALVRAQERRARDDRLRAIFATFVRDETAIAQAADAADSDVHHHRHYQRAGFPRSCPVRRRCPPPRGRRRQRLHHLRRADPISRLGRSTISVKDEMPTRP